MGIKHSVGLLVNSKAPKLYARISEFFSYLRYYSRKYTRPENYAKALEKSYYRTTGKNMDINHPETYSQKMQWLKLYDPNKMRSELTDKVKVRDWITNTIGEQYLIPIYGVYDSFDDIDFDVLPDSFVIKTNHGSGWNIVVPDKKQFDKKEARKKINKWMKIDYSFWTVFEIHYSAIKPKIIIEKYVTDHNGELNDYKFLCFNGVCKYVWVDFDRSTNHKRNVYDMNWNLQPWNQFTYGNKLGGGIHKPENFEEMANIANQLCKGFIHVRVDLYNVDGKVYFGEMTFTNGSGLEGIYPETYEKYLGDEIHLPMD